MGRGRFSHPQGLYHLFAAELFERFGFYMVQAVLILLLTEHLKFDDARAYLLFAVYGSMSFLTPVLGGYIADRWIGFKRSIFLGSALLILGYCLMALNTEAFLFFGMALVVAGTGLFKPNMTAMVGDLYRFDDPKREGGYTLFYLCINIGMLVPPLIAGYLVSRFGWESAFWVAAASMLIAALQFWMGRSFYSQVGNIPAASFLNRGKKWVFPLLFLVGIVLFISLLQYLFLYPESGDFIIGIATLSILATIFAFLIKETPSRRKPFIACLILIVLSMGFWALYNQIYTSFTLFAERNLSKYLVGVPIDAETTQAFNPLFILLLSPIFGLMWSQLNDRKGGSPLKFSLGLLSMAVGLYILATGTSVHASSDGMASPWWLVFCNLFIAMGELFIYPVALAMIHRLAPPHLYGMMMGVWFLSVAGAFAIGGKFALFASVPETLSKSESIPIYSDAFFIYGSIALVLALLGFIITPYLKRLGVGR